MDPTLTRLIQRGSPFELQSVSVEGLQQSVFVRGPQTILHLLTRAASFGSREYVISDGQTLTYSQIFSAAQALSHKLIENPDFRHSCCVAICMESGPTWPIAFIATILAGAVPVLVPTQSTEAVAANCVLVTASRLALVSATARAQLEGRLGIPVIEVNLKQLECGTAMDVPPRWPDPSDTAMVAFTSGSTGLPRGVVLTHGNVMTGLLNMLLGGAVAAARMRSTNDRTREPVRTAPSSLITTPLHHVGGYSQLLLMAYLGGKAVVLSSRDPEEAVREMAAHNIRTWSGTSVEAVRDLLAVLRGQRNRLEGIAVQLHGATLQQTLIEEILNVVPSATIGTGYGMTETCGSIAVVAGASLIRDLSCVGPPLPTAVLKIRPIVPNLTSHEGAGEILVRGAMVAQSHCAAGGYSQITSDGWLATGDIGYLDEQGSLHVVDRIKNFVSHNGIAVPSVLLERLASSCDQVKEAVALPGRQSDEFTRVVVVLRDGAGLPTPAIRDEIMASCAKAAIPVEISFVTKLPRTGSGKVDRIAVSRDLESSQHQQRSP